MAKTVYDEEEIVLLDGTKLTLRPLSIKRTRKAMAMLSEELGETTEENPDPLTNRLLEIFQFIFEKNENAAHLVADKEELEDAVDIQTLKYVIKVVVGFDLDAALKAMMETMTEDQDGEN